VVVFFGGLWGFLDIRDFDWELEGLQKPNSWVLVIVDLQN
jgi:hypothetical protein